MGVHDLVDGRRLAWRRGKGQLRAVRDAVESEQRAELDLAH